MKDAVEVRRLRLIQKTEIQCLSAEVDGEIVWFEVPLETFREPRAEPFLAIALQEAMVRRAPLVLDSSFTVSASWVRCIERVQDVMLSWNDEDIGRVPVIAVTDLEPKGHDWRMTTFSGGVDSSFTFSQCRDLLSHVMLVQGFDSDNEDGWNRNVAARRAFADLQGVKFVPVSNNVRSFLNRRRLSWNLAHGALLASLAVAMGARSLHIPSTFTYDNLIPWGSHPVLDPLWSTAETSVIHHGAECRRTAKIRRLLADAGLLNSLQVCWRSVDKNCGQCSKCVRTSLALHLLGSRSENLPPYCNTTQLVALQPSDEASLQYVEDLIRLALETGHITIARRLQRDRRRFLMKMHAVELAKLVVGRRLRELIRARSTAAWRSDRVKLRSNNESLEVGGLSD